MTATVEIDKAGRIVVPKKLRDSLHLVPGTRVTFRLEGDAIIMAPEAQPRGLYMDRGTLVYDPGPLPPIDTLEWLAKSREERLDSFALEQAGK
jgi:AbrB family looped-hinge helix DNA binding protein